MQPAAQASRSPRLTTISPAPPTSTCDAQSNARVLVLVHQITAAAAKTPDSQIPGQRYQMKAHLGVSTPTNSCLRTWSGLGATHPLAGGERVSVNG